MIGERGHVARSVRHVAGQPMRRQHPNGSRLSAINVFAAKCRERRAECSRSPRERKILHYPIDGLRTGARRDLKIFSKNPIGTVRGGRAQDHRRAKLVRRLPLELHLALFPQG